MNSKTMEGLVGARTNGNLINTPMRVFKEARRKGDTATMDRAMGYVGEFSGKVEEYKAEADKGMEEDAREAREKAKLEREEAVQKRKEERKKLEERIDDSRCLDTVEISEEGKLLFIDNVDLNNTGFDGTNINAVEEPVTYTKEGNLAHTEHSTGISVSV